MRFLMMFVILCLILFSMPILHYKYKRGEIFPSKMPANTEELATWSSDDLTRLKKSLKCTDVPGYKDDELIEFKQWRKACNTVRDYWMEAYDKERTEENLERFRKLDLPK